MSDVEFRAVSEETIELMRNWRNSPRIRNNMFSNNIISKEQQQKWFHNQKTDNSSQYFVCHLDNKPIGSLYFSDILDDSCYWGCFIGEDRVLPGFGLVLEYAALEYAFSTLCVKTLHTEVFEKNLPPHKIHNFFGYEKVSSYTRQVPSQSPLIVLKYMYNRSDWQIKSRKVERILPKNITKICKKIVFVRR